MGWAGLGRVGLGRVGWGRLEWVGLARHVVSVIVELNRQEGLPKVENNAVCPE